MPQTTTPIRRPRAHRPRLLAALLPCLVLLCAPRPSVAARLTRPAFLDSVAGNRPAFRCTLEAREERRSARRNGDTLTVMIRSGWLLVRDPAGHARRTWLWAERGGKGLTQEQFYQSYTGPLRKAGQLGSATPRGGGKGEGDTGGGGGRRGGRGGGRGGWGGSGGGSHPEGGGGFEGAGGREAEPGDDSETGSEDEGEGERPAHREAQARPAVPELLAPEYPDQLLEACDDIAEITSGLDTLPGGVAEVTRLVCEDLTGVRRETWVERRDGRMLMIRERGPGETSSVTRIETNLLLGSSPPSQGLPLSRDVLAEVDLGREKLQIRIHETFRGHAEF